jgi:hypothetical protein
MTPHLAVLTLCLALPAAAQQAPIPSAPAQQLPAKLEYLKIAEDNWIQQFVGNRGLNQWRNPGFDLFEQYNAFRNDVIAHLDARAKLPVSLRNLPEPELNGMVLEILQRKANFFRFNGEKVAFMAKYAMDGHTVRWIQLGGDEDDEWSAAVSERPKRDRRLRLNCAQFVRYSMYLAGMPKDRNKSMVTMTDRRKQFIIDPNFIGLSDWMGWWKAHADSNDTFSYKGVAMMPGDLLVLYNHKLAKSEIFASKTDGGWEFYHVEVITKEDAANDNNTASIGNSGKEPHYSTLLSNLTRLGQWIDEAFTNTSFLTKESVDEWRYVIYRFDQQRRVNDGTVDLASLKK